MITYRQLCSTPAQICYFLVLMLLVLGISAKAQNPPPTVYVSYSYMKTAPAKFDAYDSLLKIYSKKIVENEIKGGNLLQWSGYEVLSPTGSQTDYNVVVVAVSDKLEMLLDPPGTNKEMLLKNFPNLSQAQRDKVAKQFGEARTLVKKEIYAVMTTTGENDGPPTATPAKYIAVDYMTPVAGKEGEYATMEIETFKPIHKERIKMGASLGWVMLRKVLPADSKDDAPFVTVNMYNDFSGMMNGKYEEAMKVVYPNQDATKVFDKINTVKKGQRVEVWKLMVSDSMQGVAASK
jgi:hypothetical protein